MTPKERARRASCDLLDFTGLTQREAAALVNMHEKRMSERLRDGTLYLRDFLEIANAEGGADFLRMLADRMDAEDTKERPIDVAMASTEAAADVQGIIRRARADGHFCYAEIVEMQGAALHSHAKTTRLVNIANTLVPGPVPHMLAAE